MIHLDFDRKTDQSLQVLCLGAHSDDIEIGCGGTILRLSRQHPGSVFHWVVLSGEGVRVDEAQRAARLFAGSGLRGPTLKAFRDGFMPYQGTQVKEVFEELGHTLSPDIIFTHNREDAHQDHRLLGELTWNTFRNHFILEYEIPKYDGDMGRPAIFVPLDLEECQIKVSHLMNAFQSQQKKRWFDENTFLSVMRLRGMECNSLSGYAEAFYCRKVLLR